MAASARPVPDPHSPFEQLRLGRDVIRTEGQTLLTLADRMGEEFCHAVALLAQTPGSVEAYLRFLKSGGSKFPLETLQAAGVDMTTPAPIESTLRLFERRLAELEELLL